MLAIRQQLAKIYDLMYVEGQAGYEQIAYDERLFGELSALLDLLPNEGLTELLYRLSEGVPVLKVAELYNILIWSADARGTVDPEELQGWFYRRERRRVEVVARIDLFPSNSMDESERILAVLQKRFPDLDYLLAPLASEVAHRKAEEEAWSKYRRETFEMPKEVTPSILQIIENIKTR